MRTNINRALATLFLLAGFCMPAHSQTDQKKTEETEETEKADKTHYYRILGGYQGAIGNSAAPKGAFYFDVFASTPITDKWRTWGSVRITATPRQVNASVKEFIPSLPEQVGSVKINEIGHSGEAIFGLERRFKLKVNDKYRIGLIGGAGITIPATPRESIEVFRVSPELAETFPQTQGKEFVAFVPPEFDRVLYQWQVGVRFTTLENQSNPDPEATFEISYGGNEFLTGRLIRTPVMKAEAMYRMPDIPSPSKSIKFRLYLFYGGSYRLGELSTRTPLVLEGAPEGTNVPAPNVAIVVKPRSRLDISRFGIAIDFRCIFSDCSSN